MAGALTAQTSGGNGGGGDAPALASLRAELQFTSSDGALATDGVLFDPLRNRHFRLDAVTAEILSLWPSCRTADELSRECARRLGLLASPRQIEALERFLVANELTVPEREADWRRLAEKGSGARKGWISWLIHNYLFVQLPLFEPKRLLDRLVPATAPLFTRTAAVVIALIGIAGLYLVSRQWDTFLATFSGLLSLEGALIYAVAIALVKTLHELGHAVTAARAGAQVPSMGICFMVGMPMLYCDVTDAWRVPSWRRRVEIGAAGLAVETALAAIATLAWVFLPDGAMRSVTFAVATTSWVMSLGLNLNPFMRFDGYYILADLTGVDNLQPRAFDVGVWRLREILFGLGQPAPEDCSRRRLHAFALYAWAVWFYRLVVFTGIAVMVYSLSFKLLGLALFAVEIVFFIARPIARELGAWMRMAKQILARPRTYVTLAVSIALIGLMLTPLPTRIAIPAVIEDQELQRIYPKRAAMIAEAPGRLGQPIDAGGIVIRLTQPELEHEIRRTEMSANAIRLRLERRSADATDKAESFVLEDALASLAAKLAGLKAEREELTIRAEHGGTIVEIDRLLVPGRWVQRTDPIAVIAGGKAVVVRGYLGENDIARLNFEGLARFVPENPLASAFDVRLDTIAAAGSEEMDLPELSSHYGGGVPARSQQRPGKARVQIPMHGQFLITGLMAEPQALDIARASRGVLHASGRPESMAERAFRQVLKVLIRESGM